MNARGFGQTTLDAGGPGTSPMDVPQCSTITAILTDTGKRLHELNDRLVRVGVRLNGPRPSESGAPDFGSDCVRTLALEVQNLVNVAHRELDGIEAPIG